MRNTKADILTARINAVRDSTAVELGKAKARSENTHLRISRTHSELLKLSDDRTREAKTARTALRSLLQLLIEAHHCPWWQVRRRFKARRSLRNYLREITG